MDRPAWKCQRLVQHRDAYTHAMAGYEQRCKRNAVTSRQITSGKTVEVCKQHAAEVDRRLASNFFKTPDSFFDWSQGGDGQTFQGICHDCLEGKEKDAD